MSSHSEVKVLQEVLLDDLIDLLSSLFKLLYVLCFSETSVLSALGSEESLFHSLFIAITRPLRMESSVVHQF